MRTHKYGTLAVTEGFADYSNCLFIVSTHIIEVGDALQGKKNIQFVFMPTSMEGSIPAIPTNLRKVLRKTGKGCSSLTMKGYWNCWMKRIKNLLVTP